MLEIIVAERKRREVDPTVAMLAVSETRPGADPYIKAGIHDMLAFFESMTDFYQEMQRLPSGALPALIKLRSKIRKLLKGEK